MSCAVLCCSVLQCAIVCHSMWVNRSWKETSNNKYSCWSCLLWAHSVLQCAVVCHSMLQCAAVCECAAVCCSVRVCCSVLQKTFKRPATIRSSCWSCLLWAHIVLQCALVCHSMLQCAAVCECAYKSPMNIHIIDESNNSWLICGQGSWTSPQTHPMSFRKRAQYLRKRALCLRQKALYLRKYALCLRKRALHLRTGKRKYRVWRAEWWECWHKCPMHRYPMPSDAQVSEIYRSLLQNIVSFIGLFPQYLMPKYSPFPGGWDSKWSLGYKTKS